MHILLSTSDKVIFHLRHVYFLINCFLQKKKRRKARLLHLEASSHTRFRQPIFFIWRQCPSHDCVVYICEFKNAYTMYECMTCHWLWLLHSASFFIQTYAWHRERPLSTQSFHIYPPLRQIFALFRCASLSSSKSNPFVSQAFLVLVLRFKNCCLVNRGWIISTKPLHLGLGKKRETKGNRQNWNCKKILTHHCHDISRIFT